MITSKKVISRTGAQPIVRDIFILFSPTSKALMAILPTFQKKKIVSIQFTDTGNNKKIITLRPEDQETITKLTACVIDQLDELRVDTWKPKQ